MLVEAFNGLPEAGVECKIYGDMTFLPEYSRRVRNLRRHLDVKFMGEFDNKKVAEVLADMDVLVVPVHGQFGGRG